MVAQTMKIESKNVFRIKKTIDLGLLVLAVSVTRKGPAAVGEAIRYIRRARPGACR